MCRGKLSFVFAQVRKDVEPLERSLEEDVRRFAQHSVPYDTTTMASVKEAAVKMSARLLAHTLNVRTLLLVTLNTLECVQTAAQAHAAGAFRVCLCC